jgi:beta-fructofuranosidase
VTGSGIGGPRAIVHAGGRYHLLACGRHATSADLLTWDERPGGPALRPGAVVLSDRGVPALFGTEDADGGRIVRALGDPALERWRLDPAGPVIAAPPPGVRDPFVWRASEGWRMLLGGSGTVLQYRSDNLETWGYDGIVASAPGECPQLFPLGGAWVLLMSVPGDGVRYAVGDYDGATFTHGGWDRLTDGPATAFVDAAGRRCVLTGVPLALRLAGDRLLADPHPDVPSRWPA